MDGSSLRDLYAVLPTLSPDFSGVCSTLFELGGIVVIHDAGGCTGSYTGYDEPRWFDQKSRIFTSNLDDMEAIFGDDEILLGKILDAERYLDSNFVALLGSPSPAVLGTDYRALAGLIQRRTGKKTMSFPTTGTRHYDYGISLTLKSLAKTFLPAARSDIEPMSVNLIGATPLDFNRQANIEVFRQMLAEEGIGVISCWAMGSSLSDIGNSLKAEVNIALTAAAVPVCKYLHVKYHMPYVVARFFGIKPVARFIELLKRQMGNPGLCMTQTDLSVSDSLAKTGARRALVVAEQFIGCGMREALLTDLGFGEVEVVTLFSGAKEYLSSIDQLAVCEADLEYRINHNNYDLIIADALIRDLDFSADKHAFLSIPHVAISSRLGWTNKLNYFGDNFLSLVEQALQGAAR